MTVKKRISMLIIGAGLITSLLFSVVVFLEMIEQPFEILDKALKDEAYSITRMLLKQKKELNIEAFDSDYIPGYSYWLKIFEQGNNKILYQSSMVQLIRLPLIESGGKQTASIIISREIINLHQDRSQEVTFRIRSFLIAEDGKSFVVQIARPMEKLEEEIWEVIFGIGAGLILSCLVLIFISQFIAGKILQPIGKMQELAVQISEKNLNKRIPVGPEQDEFNELGRTINKMLDRLQNSFITQRTFLFDTSHELKTPLTTMRLTIDEICSDTENLPASKAETLFTLKNQVLRMERLVKDLLSLSSLETLTGIDPKTVNLGDFLSSLITDYHFIAAAQNVKIKVQLSDKLILQGSPEKLTRAFSNLLDNAIKYNVDGGRVEVISYQLKNNLDIKIGNTGPGVAETEINKVFDQFYRVEQSRSLQHGGYGLGLAIVKKTIEIHNGKITFESKPGIWTQVTITLPVHQKILSMKKL